MAASAGLAVTLIPVLMGYLIRGRIPREEANPLNRFLIAVYRPLLNQVLRFPKANARHSGAGRVCDDLSRGSTRR
jgi:Cu(I)/Ag(I) efflux system membrane protein CusA/SilA